MSAKKIIVFLHESNLGKWVTDFFSFNVAFAFLEQNFRNSKESKMLSYHRHLKNLSQEFKTFYS